MKQSEKSKEINSNYGNISRFEQLKLFSRNTFESTIDSFKSDINSTREKLIGYTYKDDKTNKFIPKFLSTASLALLTGFLNSAPAFAEQPKSVTDQFDKIKAEYGISELCNEVSSSGISIKSFRENTNSSGITTMENLGMAKLCKQELLIKSFYLGDIDSNGNFKEGVLKRYISSELNNGEGKLSDSKLDELVVNFKNNKIRKEIGINSKLSDFKFLFVEISTANGEVTPTEDDMRFYSFADEALKVEKEFEISQNSKKIETEQAENNEMIIKVLSGLAIGGGLVGSYLILKKRY